MDAESCADMLLSLEVEAYRKLVVALQENEQEEPVAYVEEDGSDLASYQAWLAEERKFWKEIEQDAKRPGDIPDWQALREQRRAKNATKSLARSAQIKLKEKNSQNQRSKQRFGQKYRECRGSRRLTDSTEDIVML